MYTLLVLVYHLGIMAVVVGLGEGGGFCSSVTLVSRYAPSPMAHSNARASFVVRASVTMATRASSFEARVSLWRLHFVRDQFV